MSIYRTIQQLQAQIVDTERLLELVKGHPLMSKSISEKLNQLKHELDALPKDSFEPRIKLLFSGNAVLGSQGIKSSFISKTAIPFQEMVKTQAALVRFGRVGRRGQAKKAANTSLYLTALPTGSFGIELSQLQAEDLFDSIDVSNAMKGVMYFIENTAKSDEDFEEVAKNVPKRTLTNLKKFLHEISNEKSMLKMESGEVGIELSKEKINEAYTRVASTVDEDNDMVINGIFRGLLLDSGRFEIQDEEGQKLSGFISEELNEDALIEYDKQFLNHNCLIHLKVHKTRFKTGNEKIDYELLKITEA